MAIIAFHIKKLPQVRDEFLTKKNKGECLIMRLRTTAERVIVDSNF